jgi:hypothetical protein
MEAVERAERRANTRSLRYCIAAVTLCAGLVVAPVPGVAWAEGTGTESTSRSTSSDSESPTGADPSNESDQPNEPESPRSPEPAAPEITTPDPELDDPAEITEEPGAEQPAAPDGTKTPEPALEQPDSDPAEAVPESKPHRKELVGSRRIERSARTSISATSSSTSGGLLTVEAPTPQLKPAAPAVDARAATPTIAPTPPKPLSPIATLLELPGRIVNAVLQFLDFTSAASGPHSPFNIAPINDLLFAAFRELERVVGLHRTPAVQPVLSTMTYDGPTDRPTPTVAQFLNASAAGYGLGTLPGGLVPLTANGFQMSSTNIFSGMVGKAWVTPQGQVIIAYQGTTGGTNLLFNPLITISQVLADMQVILTGTTPLAFYDALRFARRVQDEAAIQGYGADDVFVTGHSLGGWEAEFVAQRTGLAGIGFESPGINSRVTDNGIDSLFVNIAQYGSPAAFMATDLPALQPFMPPYVPGGGSKPHFGPIVLIGDEAAMNPMRNAAAMFGKSLIGSLIFAIDFLGNFFQYHLPGVQAYHLDVDPNPGVVPWLGTQRGTVHTGYGDLTIQQLLQTASSDGILITP